MFSWIGKLFGGEKGIVGQVSDVADKWIPSETTKHKMSIEDMQAGDSSQDSARKMNQISHSTRFDVVIDGINRLPRPIITFWVVGILFGWIGEPQHLASMNPVLLNIVWTVITFWFGARMVVKDIPAVLKSLRK